MNDYYVTLMVSRNKDNKNLPDFKERCVPFISKKEEFKKTLRRFMSFVSEGVDGEMCRLYMSVNRRDGEKIKKAMLYMLIDDDGSLDLAKIESRCARLASKPDCAIEHKWMFDFDSKDERLLNIFLSELKKNVKVESVTITPNGYAVIVEHGFDCREIIERWKDVVTLMKDAMLCIYYSTKH